MGLYMEAHDAYVHHWWGKYSLMHLLPILAMLLYPLPPLTPSPPKERTYYVSPPLKGFCTECYIIHATTSIYGNI